MNILINISEVAIITGDNTFSSRRDFFIEFWRKNAKDDYQKYISLTKFVKETDMDIIKKIAKSNNIELNSDLIKCSSTKNTTDLNIIKKEILKKVDNLNDIQKAEISKSINNVTNTKFGIKNENDVATLYNKLTGMTIIKDNKYHSVELARCKVLYGEGGGKNIDMCFLLGGKIDGICNENKCIIEIKNRIHKLFYKLRDYEKVQLMCYLFIFNLEKGHLVEAFKTKDRTDINIIELDFDHIYMNSIKSKLVKFIEYFVKFINNEDMKLNILNKNDEINF